MSETAKSGLFDEFSEGFGSLWTILEDQAGQSFGSLTVQARKLISEAAIFLHEMMEQADLDVAEEEFAHSWLRQFGHILGREFEGSFILRFYYFSRDYARDPATTVHSMISLVVALRALEICGPKLTRGGTVWEYLERDIPRFRKALENILGENSTEERIDELFLLLNTIDMLAAIDDSEKLTCELEEFIKLVSERKISFDKAFEISPGLRVYAADLVNRVGLPIHVGDLPIELHGKPGAFLALMELRRGKIPSLDQLKRAYHPSALHLWWIAKAWTRLRVGEAFVGILPFYRRLDVDAVFRLVWGDAKKLYEITVTTEEMGRVLTFTGQEIKQQLYDYFRMHPQVTEFSRARLPAERDKADAGGEISDFNVEFITGKENIWIAIPIKSGREVRTRSRDKIEQDFIYQFIRPLVNFETDKIIVFPIILVRPTLNANEFVSLIRARLQLPILVLDIETYTRFLKRENVLSS
jgi:hypothetical protein